MAGWQTPCHPKPSRAQGGQNSVVTDGQFSVVTTNQDKLRTLLGWEDPGRYGEKHGVKASFNKYMPQLVETFSSFEKDHRTASTLQAFRYQIAQAYWSNKDWAKTREWLNLIIKVSGEGDSFYKDLSERRLQKVEY